jgi:8-oxo-dGTP diphosphatase
MTQHKELVHIHFWHDKHGTITGCYEAEAREFASVAEVLALSNLMDYARWAFLECINKGLLTCP